MTFENNKFVLLGNTLILFANMYKLAVDKLSRLKFLTRRW